MVKTKVGYSENTVAYESGVETATMANGGKAKAGLLFTSVVQDQKEIIKGVKSVMGDIPFVGCTSSAAICTHDGYLNKETGYSAMMTFSDDVEIVVAGSEKTDESAREIGRRIAKEAMSQVKGSDREPDYFFMTASPAEEEEYLKGIQDVIGDIPVFGGSAADNTVEGKWSIICNDKVFADGCAIAIFFADNEMKNVYTGVYEETENVGIITKLNGIRCLAEIDGVPAVEKYAEWTGKNVDDLMGSNLLTETIFDPLGVKDPIGNVTAVRHPMFANDDLSMNIGANLAVNTAIIQLHGTPESIVAANPATVEKVKEMMEKEVQSYFLVHCGGRRLGLQLANAESNIYPEVVKATGGKEFLMVFTFGEYGKSEHSSNTVGGLSLSFTGFSE